MSLFFLKSILSIVMLVFALIAMFTMFEIFGKSDKKYSIEKLKRLHKVNGIVYLLIYIFIAYFCLSFIIDTKGELSPRGTFHSIFALTIIVLLGLKISIVRIYRQFYNQVKILGLLIALITFGMVGTSGGYYLLVTKFGTEKIDRARYYKNEVSSEEVKTVIRIDEASIKKGKKLYESKCYLCHDPYSTKTIVGPGLMGILKNPSLPVSGKPAIPESIINQLRNPYRYMPSFSYLSEEEMLNIIAYLNTL
ncbi:MAG TPA: hypothetical protein DEP99_01150 [Nitrospiraceae bacterium]|nr:hypothetical protein [Nitrospiraceae bacterium]